MIPRSSQHYWELMRRCLQSADSMQTEQQRAAFLQLAKTWHQVLQVEKTLRLIEEAHELWERSKSCSNPRPHA
jgi:hypothetical protein